MILGFLAILALITANGLFVAAEFALISARRDRLQTLADQGRGAAREVIAVGGRLPAMITGAQLGVTLASLALGWVAEPILASVLRRGAELVGVPPVLATPAALLLALAFVAAVHVLFGEMVPKNLALAGPERAAMLLTGALRAWVRATAPITWMFQQTASMILRAFGVVPKDELEGAVSVAELGEMISESRKVGLLDEEEHSRLTRLLSIGERTVAEVAVPIEQIVSLAARITGDGVVTGPTVSQIEEAVARTGFSRFPVRRERSERTESENNEQRPVRRPMEEPPGNNEHSPGVAKDGSDFLGYVHLKDALPMMTSGAVLQEGSGPALRPLARVQAELALDEALKAVLEKSAQLAVVTDGHGVPVGLVSLEDLVGGLMDGPRNTLK